MNYSKKKALIPLTSIMLLILVSIILFQSIVEWFSVYSKSQKIVLEGYEDIKIINITKVSANNYNIAIKNKNKYPANILKVFINGTNCQNSKIFIKANSISTIAINNCGNHLQNYPIPVQIITEKDRVEKYLFLN